MNVPFFLIVGSITVAGAAILAFFIKGNGTYGRAFFWSLLMLIGLMALLMKIFNSNY